MNWATFILGIVPGVVQSIEVVVGDAASGATKAKMAQDALGAAVNTASKVLTGNNAVYGEVAAGLAQLAINQTVSIARATGVYGKWTAAAAVAQQDTLVAAQVAALVHSIENPAPAPSPVQGQPQPTGSKD